MEKSSMVLQYKNEGNFVSPKILSILQIKQL